MSACCSKFPDCKCYEPMILDGMDYSAAELLARLASSGPCLILINSPGGNAQEGDALHQEALRLLKNKLDEIFGDDFDVMVEDDYPTNGVSIQQTHLEELADNPLNLWPKKMEDPCEYLQDPRDQIRAPVIRSKVKPIKAKTSGPAFNRRLDKRGRNPFRKPNL